MEDDPGAIHRAGAVVPSQDGWPDPHYGVPLIGMWLAMTLECSPGGVALCALRLRHTICDGHWGEFDIAGNIFLAIRIALADGGSIGCGPGGGHAGFHSEISTGVTRIALSGRI